MCLVVCFWGVHLQSVVIYVFVVTHRLQLETSTRMADIPFGDYFRSSIELWGGGGSGEKKNTPGIIKFE